MTQFKFPAGCKIALAKCYFDKNRTQAKIRPILILQQTATHLTYFEITSQFDSKSAFFKQFLIPILDRKVAGLNKASFIKLTRFESTPIDPTWTLKILGQLSARDTQQINDSLTMSIPQTIVQNEWMHA